MSSVEPKTARGLLGGFKRLDLIYFALAAVDLFTICAALYLNHTVTSAFEDAVRTSAAWSSRQVEIIRLGRLAQQADAPGNDVFTSGDVVGERARHLEAYRRFNAAALQFNADIIAAPLSASDAELVGHLALVNAKMGELASRSELTFSEYERGRMGAAAHQMAAMDRIFGELTAGLDQALAVVDRTRTETLDRQLQYARDMRNLELIMACAVLLIVGLVATYGVYIGRTMRAAEGQRLAMLSEVASARDRLQHYADDVSHELRGPIGKMRLEAEVLLNSDRSPQQYRNGIESFLSECERISSIVESLLFMARAENTRMAINRQPIDLDKECRLVIDFYAAAAEKAEIAIERDIARVMLHADRSLFQRAFNNLLSNAIKNTPSGGHVKVSARGEGDAIVVEVGDDGVGMSQEERLRAFDRFYRGGRRTGAGLGLGLAITKSIMDLHGGTVELLPGARAGTRARLIFPGADLR